MNGTDTLRAALERYAAAMHKLGQESVRHSGYEDRAKQLADEARAELAAALASEPATSGDRDLLDARVRERKACPKCGRLVRVRTNGNLFRHLDNTRNTYDYAVPCDYPQDQFSPREA